MIELKPCPFCGSVAVILKTFVVGENEWFYATCCACKAEINNPMPIAEEAVNRWNRRSTMANDLISRNALLRSLNDHAPKPTTDDLYEVNLCIINAPAVDAAPVVHGRFVGTEYDGYADGNPVYYEWQCSECGCVFEDNEPTYNYCPYCGAKMDGGEDDADTDANLPADD